MSNYIQQTQLRSTLTNYVIGIMQHNNIPAMEMENALIYVLNALKDQVREDLVSSILESSKPEPEKKEEEDASQDIS